MRRHYIVVSGPRVLGNVTAGVLWWRSADARHRAPRTEDSAVASSSSDKTSCLADEASDLQIRALLMLLQEEDNAVVRRSILPIIAGKWAHVLGHDL